jgi:hypothetical protein
VQELNPNQASSSLGRPDLHFNLWNDIVDADHHYTVFFINYSRYFKEISTDMLLSLCIDGGFCHLSFSTRGSSSLLLFFVVRHR